PTRQAPHVGSSGRDGGESEGIMGKRETLVEGKARTGVNTGWMTFRCHRQLIKNEAHNRMNRSSMPYLITKYQSGAKHDAGRQSMIHIFRDGTVCLEQHQDNH